jgi:hypothetical protein
MLGNTMAFGFRSADLLQNLFKCNSTTESITAFFVEANGSVEQRTRKIPDETTDVR